MPPMMTASKSVGSEKKSSQGYRSATQLHKERKGSESDDASSIREEDGADEVEEESSFSARKTVFGIDALEPISSSNDEDRLSSVPKIIHDKIISRSTDAAPRGSTVGTRKSAVTDVRGKR